MTQEETTQVAKMVAAALKETNAVSKPWFSEDTKAVMLDQAIFAGKAIVVGGVVIGVVYLGKRIIFPTA